MTLTAGLVTCSAVLVLVLLAIYSRDRPTAAEAAVLPRVVVMTGSYGAGHDAAARQIARVLAENAVAVETLDMVDLYPLGLGRILRSLYFAQLAAAPRSWEWLLQALSRHGRGDEPGETHGSVAALLGWLPSRIVRQHLDSGVLAVVSTHPFASAALGRLRRRGECAAPVATYLTDASVHALWVHADVDVHLAIYPEAARQARELGIPAGRPVALVVGGSEGVGELEASAADVAATGLATTVVACGPNEALRSRLEGRHDVVALGWVDDLADLVSAADCLVQNAGGFTVLEALSGGTPVVSYRCLPGHGVDNAAALARDGFATWPRRPADLADAIATSLTLGASGHAPMPTLLGRRQRPSVVQVLELQPTEIAASA